MEHIMNVYIVRGSEDGHIGVYGSRAKALEAAINYCCDEWGNTSNVEVDDRIKRSGLAWVTGNGVSADVEYDRVIR